MSEPEQLSFDAMPTQLFACTPNRLATFDCPRRYRFTYLDRPTPPRGAPWARSTLGAVAHLALYRWWTLPRAHRTPDEGASLVERNWQDAGFRDAAQSMRACITTAGWVSAYLSGIDPGDEPIGVERTVAVRTQALAVSGRVDRLDDRAGEVVVVDYKTGRRTPTADDARDSQALALYVLGARRTLRRACRRVELHHLPTGTIAAFEHTDASLRAHEQQAERTAAEIIARTDALDAGADRDDAFAPRTSSACAWCDFRRHCPEGAGSCCRTRLVGRPARGRRVAVLSVGDDLALLGAGVAAGLAGSVAGLASLFSYPALLAVGLPPVTANTTNTVALVFNSIGSASASRPELSGQRVRLRRLGVVAVIGGSVGGALLLLGPAGVFEKIVPWLIGFGSLAILIRPRVVEEIALHERPDSIPVLAATFVIGVYGGYFGAAAGVLLLALLLAMTSESLARANAVKNVVLGLANFVAAVVFVIFGSVSWVAAVPLAVGFFAGGRVGPLVVRHAPATLLRMLIAAAGVGLAVYLGIGAYG